MTAIMSAPAYNLARAAWVSTPVVYPSVDIPRSGPAMASSRHVVPLVRAEGPARDRDAERDRLPRPVLASTALVLEDSRSVAMTPRWVDATAARGRRAPPHGAGREIPVTRWPTSTLRTQGWRRTASRRGWSGASTSRDRAGARRGRVVFGDPCAG